MNTPEEEKAYAESIRQLVPINELSHDVQNDIIKHAQLIYLKNRQPLFNQGDRDNFSFYLLEGEIQLEANGQVHSSITAGTDRAIYPMAQLQPRQFSGKASIDSVVFRMERNALDKLLVMNQGNESDELADGANVEVGMVEMDEEDSVDWMSRMLSSEIFSGMPTANIHQLFALMEPVEYKAGDNIITQGETGENYYIIQEGRCEVLRHTKPGAKEIKLAELKPGDGFGEEALITETVRNATIRMLTDGMVAHLSKDNFVTLIQNPTIKAVSRERAEEIIDGAGKWLDVRYKNEHDRNAIEDSLHVPLNILRLKADALARDTHYVAYCDTGGRSSTAAFLLTERGFTVSYLDGGLVNHPELALPEDVTAIPRASEPAPEPATPESGAPEKANTPAAKPEPAKPEPVTAVPAENDDEDLDPEIMATVLNAELTRTNMEIDRASKLDQTDIRHRETAKKLDEERARIEEQKKKVEADVARLRQQEEQRLKQLEQASEKRMQEERKKIEAVYSRNAEEIEKLEKMKQEAETKLRAEQERLEREADEARKNKQDTEKIRQQLELARKAMDDENRKRELQQEEMRKKIEMEARRKIEIEKRKLAEQFARNNQEIEQARREKAIAEAAREAARKEAELMIEEYKSQHKKTREEEEQQIREERLKLEQEQKKIQVALQGIQKTRAEAEAMKRKALAEVTALKARQLQEDVARSDSARNELKDKIKTAQAKLTQASEKAARVEQDEEKAVVAQKVNSEDLQKKKQEEEALAKQLSEDLNEFKAELDEQEREYANSKTQLEHMKRIKERAEAAKREAQAANSDLLSEISSQLGDE